MQWIKQHIEDSAPPVSPGMDGLRDAYLGTEYTHPALETYLGPRRTLANALEGLGSPSVQRVPTYNSDDIPKLINKHTEYEDPDKGLTSHPSEDELMGHPTAVGGGEWSAVRGDMSPVHHASGMDDDDELCSTNSDVELGNNATRSTL